ncbi:MAG: hypothetical protein AAF415_08555 [Pseudomonadota bacterium]
MSVSTFGQTNAAYPWLTGSVASVVIALSGLFSAGGSDLRALSVAEREDLGLSPFDMHRLGA